MSTTIQINRAHPKDFTTVAELVFQLLCGFNTSREKRFILDLEQVKNTTLGMFSKEGFVAFIASQDNNAIGVLTMTRASAIYNGGDFGVITEFYVIPEYRSIGAGAKLLETAKDYARSMLWKKIEVGAPKGEQWLRTVSFYEKNNFVKTGPKLSIDIN